MKLISLRWFSYTVWEQGKGVEYTFFFQKDGKPISPWHDIPLKNSDGTFNAVIEIPNDRIAKMECAADEPLNPIKQDTQKNWFTGETQLRYYAKFPYFNYGFLPQTWENSLLKNKKGYLGDDDPLDICELSSSAFKIGDVWKVKILGALELIDQNELDWKILCID